MVVSKAMDYHGEIKMKTLPDLTSINELADALRVSSSLMRLLIGDSAIGDEGCTAVAEAMQQNESCKIEELNLDKNGIGVAGAKSLAAMMAARGSLTE
eukprot:2355843-Prymnesium_polylepis.2